ncbi:MAG TPA: ABC transporter ATP-binding protein, partial [Candidatus Aphodousia faecigallinarum]|nr:ABC transporter ATP-binding protein [Candidatus Aphodousia faecigallinarum]
MSAPVAISLHSVSRFETGAGNPILNAVSAEFKKGQLIALVGADGAGKTTLMRVMAGLLKPQEGSVQFFGRELYTQELNQLQTLCGYMPQQFGLYTDLSVGENLTLYADLFGLSDIERKNRFEQLLKMTGLSAFTDRPAGKLSGGMKQKLGLACALLNRPQILLLDEPTVGVDPLSRKELWTILKDSVKSGDMTIVVATTYMDEASLCDDVVIIENGEVVLHDSPEAIARLAQGLCFNLLVPRGEKMRELQALLLDDIEEVLDAVPQAGKIRLLLKEASDREAIEKKYAVRLDLA